MQRLESLQERGNGKQSEQIEKIASAERYLAYTIKLLKELTDKEQALLSDSDISSQRALMWLAFCRTYPLIGKFADTVINQKFNHHDFILSTGDWNEFLSRESHEHQEIEDIGKASRAKAKSVLFGNLFAQFFPVGAGGGQFFVVDPVKL